jgi:hypothetical protein
MARPNQITFPALMICIPCEMPAINAALASLKIAGDAPSLYAWFARVLAVVTLSIMSRRPAGKPVGEPTKA